MKYIFLFILTLSFFSCKDESAASGAEDTVATEQTADENTPPSLKVPVKKNTAQPEPTVIQGTQPKVTDEDRARHNNIRSDAEKRRVKEELAKKASKVQQPQSSNTITRITLEDSKPLPNACSFLSKEWLEEYFDISRGSVNVKNGSNPNIPYANGCFFRWDDGGVPNSGVMVQIQRNPVPDEYPDWNKNFISNKKTAGETAFGGSPGAKVLFKDFPGIGDEGAYTYEGSKYYWRMGDHIFMVAFNLGLKEEDQYQAAEDIAEMVMKNF